MNKALITPQHDAASHRWHVRFDDFRCRDDRQREATAEVGALAFDVLRLWLKVITPNAQVLEPQGSSVRHILFSRRSDMRRFTQVWGGRAAATAPPASTPSRRQG
jgi:hypothetical protein